MADEAIINTGNAMKKYLPSAKGRWQECLIWLHRLLMYVLNQWYSTFFVRVSPDIISLQLCTPKVVGV
jgi:hypothetical protein